MLLLTLLEASCLASTVTSLLGLAFRVHMLGSKAGGAVSMSDLAAALSHQYRDDNFELDLMPPTAPMVALSGALVLLASPGALQGGPQRAAVAEAALRGCPIHIVAHSSVESVKALLGVASTGGASAGTSAMAYFSVAWNNARVLKTQLAHWPLLGCRFNSNPTPS
eukprot:gene10427-8377_t